MLVFAVLSGGVAGAQSTEQYASETAGGKVPVLEERVREQGVLLEGRSTASPPSARISKSRRLGWRVPG